MEPADGFIVPEFAAVGAMRVVARGAEWPEEAEGVGHDDADDACAGPRGRGADGVGKDTARASGAGWAEMAVGSDEEAGFTDPGKALGVWMLG